MANSIGLERSRLKIPMMDFASITYLPEIKSKSYSNCEITLTKDFTFPIEFNEICTVFIIENLLCYYLVIMIVKVFFGKVKYQYMTKAIKEKNEKSGITQSWLQGKRI
jgi:hypothetical protein